MQKAVEGSGGDEGDDGRGDGTGDDVKVSGGEVGKARHFPIVFKCINRPVHKMFESVVECNFIQTHHNFG